jgi:cytochrome c5
MRKMTIILLCSSAFLYACDSSNDTAKKAVDEKVVAAVDSAIETTGTVVEPVKEAFSDVASETVTTSSEVVASVGADDGEQGESIYKSKCIACHGPGIAGAPKLGDKAVWAPRIAQGDAVLNQHAIKGFKGKTGVMPAKGGFVSLSDEEISFAVQYMVSQSK